MISACSCKGAFAFAFISWLLLLGGGPRVPVQGCETDDPDGYDPGATGEPIAAEILELSVHDQERRREIPLRLMLPSPKPARPAPVILFSHGLGGTRRTSEFLGVHWAARGYAVVFPQHAGSDDSVWKDSPMGQRRAAFIRAASPKNAQDRVLDIHAVLDALIGWAITDGHPLAGRLDLSHIGMSGHSFGAITTQTLSGQADSLVQKRQSDRRIHAAIAMSPAIPPQADLTTVFGSVRIPWLMMTGSKDYAPIGRMSPETRRDVFNHLPQTIDRYELVLGGAHHFAFTSNELPAEMPPRNTHHHRTILRISTAFWDAYLRQDPSAKLWLQGQSIRSILDPGDRWRIGVATAEPMDSPSDLHPTKEAVGNGKKIEQHRR